MQPDPIKALLRSRKFWLLVFGVFQTLLFSALPNFPPDVWKAIDALVIWLIGAIALEDASAKGAEAVVRLAGVAGSRARPDDPRV